MSFGANIDQASVLIDAKTVTIARLLEIAPAGTVDPTPFLVRVESNACTYARACERVCVCVCVCVCVTSSKIPIHVRCRMPRLPIGVVGKIGDHASLLEPHSAI